jgi:hypothetical protein
MDDQIQCGRCGRPLVYVRFVARGVSGYQCLACGLAFGPEVTARWTWGRYRGRFATRLLPYCRLPWASRVGR